MATVSSKSTTADSSSRIEELSDGDLEQYMAIPSIPLAPWLTADFLMLPNDTLDTTTSRVQHETQAECMPYLLLDDTQGLPLNSYGLPHLRRQTHIAFLHKAFESYPAPYMAMDAARPWFFYWVLQGLTALDQDAKQYKERLQKTLAPLQNASGGFAGGHGQYSHCATSYACVLALVMVDGQDMIDRDAMWRFIGQMKQADGGFRVAEMAEEDIRGAYCAMTIVSLLNLPLDLPPDAPARQAGLTRLTDGLGEWIGSCQTYEGGIAGAPSFEAHGAYLFCALACLSIIDDPARSISHYLDVSALTRWMATIQTSPEGGFAGRTNKLVDACYSHWVGGSWALLEAVTPMQGTGSCWNRAALVRYLLTCGQQPGKKGGMRDKPSARPDAYHTCYSLSGLSAAQHVHAYDKQLAKSHTMAHLSAPFGWTATTISQEERAESLIEDIDIVASVHPVFVIPFAGVESAYAKFSS